MSAHIPGCDVCGALLIDVEKHAQWHSSDEPQEDYTEMPSEYLNIKWLCTDRNDDEPSLNLLCSKAKGHKGFHYDPVHDWSWVNQCTATSASGKQCSYRADNPHVNGHEAIIKDTGTTVGIIRWPT